MQFVSHWTFSVTYRHHVALWKHCTIATKYGAVIFMSLPANLTVITANLWDVWNLHVNQMWCALNQKCTGTFPDKGASDSLDELEPQCVSVGLGQVHLTDPQTRFCGWREFLCGFHPNRSVRVPVPHFSTRTQNKDVDLRGLRSENDAESK